jgi:hypothetical protein
MSLAGSSLVLNTPEAGAAEVETGKCLDRMRKKEGKG